MSTSQYAIHDIINNLCKYSTNIHGSTQTNRNQNDDRRGTGSTQQNNPKEIDRQTNRQTETETETETPEYINGGDPDCETYTANEKKNFFFFVRRQKLDSPGMARPLIKRA